MKVRNKSREREKISTQLRQSRDIKLAREQAAQAHDLRKIGAQGLETRKTVGASSQGQMDLAKVKSKSALEVGAQTQAGRLATQGLVGEQAQANIASRGNLISQQIQQRGGLATEAATAATERAREDTSQARAFDLYKSGGDPATSASVASSGQWGIDYSGLTQREKPKKYKRTQGLELETDPETGIKTYGPANIFDPATSKSTLDYSGLGLESKPLETLSPSEKQWLLEQRQQQ